MAGKKQTSVNGDIKKFEQAAATFSTLITATTTGVMPPSRAHQTG